MTTAGIITEYNPLHMGHVHLMAEARRLLGPETGILCVMRGNYVQRGDFAIVDKAARAAAAPEVRDAYLHDAEAILLEDAPVIPVCCQGGSFRLAEGLSGLYRAPDGVYFLYYLEG